MIGHTTTPSMAARGTVWRKVAFVLAITAMAGLGTAQADMVYFSGAVSDGDETNLDVFTASIDYSYDPVGNVLTMAVTNSSNPAYTLAEVFMNVSSDVTGLVLTGNGGFTSASLVQNTNANGFGIFDYKLDILVPGNNGLGSPGTATFTFAAAGTNLSTADFFVGIDEPAGALKFTQGPGDDSVYVLPKIIPEPASMTLLGIGIAALAFRMRKR